MREKLYRNGPDVTLQYFTWCGGINVGHHSDALAKVHDRECAGAAGGAVIGAACRAETDLRPRSSNERRSEGGRAQGAREWREMSGSWAATGSSDE